MAWADFGFTPSTGLSDTTSFPTTPADETAARSQFMAVLNQIKTFLNLTVKETSTNLAAHLAETVHVGAIDIASGDTSGPTTTSTSYVDLTDMSVTLTTKGGDLLVFFSGIFKNSTSGQTVFIVPLIDSEAVTSPSQMGMTEPGTNSMVPMSLIHRFTGVAAGSHTVKIQWLVSDGTAAAEGKQRQLIVLEVKAPC